MSFLSNLLACALGASHEFWLGFCECLGCLAVCVLAYELYERLFERLRPRGSLVLPKRPEALPPAILSTLGQAEPAEWLNQGIHHIFFVAGGIELVKVLHQAFLAILEQKSSSLQSSELRLFINRLQLVDFQLGASMPKVRRVYMRQLEEKAQNSNVDIGDWALVFDVHFDRGNMLTELQARMGLGLSTLSLKLWMQRFIGKLIIKLERQPNSRISLMLTDTPQYRLAFKYGQNALTKLSHALEKVTSHLVSTRLLYPHYLTFMLNPQADCADHLFFVSPANSAHAIVRIKVLSSQLGRELLAKELSQLQWSIQIGEDKFKTASAPPSKNGFNQWEAVNCFSVIDTGDLQATIRLINKRKILGNETLALTEIPLADFPRDSLEHLTLQLEPNVSVCLELFYAKKAVSAFFDREWVFWNGNPAVDAPSDDISTLALDSINWASVKFLLDQLITANPQLSEQSDVLSDVEQPPNPDFDVAFRDCVELFYHAAYAYTCKAVVPHFPLEEPVPEDPLRELLRALLSDFRLHHLGILLKGSSERLHTAIRLTSVSRRRRREVDMMLTALRQIDELDVSLADFEDMSSGPLREVHPVIVYSSSSYNLTVNPCRDTSPSRTFLLRFPFFCVVSIKEMIVSYENHDFSDGNVCLPVVHKGQKCCLFVNDDFIWWASASAPRLGLIIIYDCVQRATISEVVYRRPNVHFLSIKRDNELSASLKVVTSDTELEFGGAPQILDQLYACFQLEDQTLVVSEKHLLGSYTDDYSICINKTLLLPNAPLALYNCLNTATSLEDSEVELHQPLTWLEPALAKALFTCSFLYRGLMDVSVSVFDEHLVMSGTQNKFKNVKAILPLRDVMEVSMVTRPMFGEGVKLTLRADTDTGSESIVLYRVVPATAAALVLEIVKGACN